MKNSEIKIRVSEEMKVEWQKMAVEQGFSLSELIIRSVNSVPTNVPTKRIKKIVPTEIVPTRAQGVDGDILVSKTREEGSIPSEPVSLKELKEELLVAMEMGDPQNWDRVKELVRVSGYEWDGTTKCLSQNGMVVWRGYSRY